MTYSRPDPLSLSRAAPQFQRVLREDETDPEAREARVASLQKHMIQEVYAYVSRALFNEDRLTFAMHLARVLARRKVDAKAGAVLSRSLSLRGSQKLISLDSEWDVFLLRAPPTAPATSVQVPQWVRPEVRCGAVRVVQMKPRLLAHRWPSLVPLASAHATLVASPNHPRPLWTLAGPQGLPFAPLRPAVPRDPVQAC